MSILVRKPSTERARCEGRDVRGNDQEARLERLLVEDELEIQAQQEEDGAEGDRVQKLGEEAAGELADAQEFQIEKRMGMASLQEDEGREAGGGEDEEARDRRGLRYAIRRDGQREQQAQDEHGERSETAPVDRRALFQLRHLPEAEMGPGRPENPDRDV